MISETRKAKKIISTFTAREKKVYEYLRDGYKTAVSDLFALNKAEEIADKPSRIKICENRIWNFAYTANCLGLHFAFEPFAKQVEIEISEY